MADPWITHCTKSMAHKIATMRSEGQPYTTIGKKMGFSRNVIARYHRLHLLHGDAIFANDRGANK